MKKILVLTDFSDNSVNAYKYAVQLACQIKADILLTFCSNGEPISLTNQLQFSQKLYSFAKRYACDSRLKTNPNSTECIISGESWLNAIASLIAVNQPDLIIAGSELLNQIDKIGKEVSMKIFERCPVLWIPEKATFKELSALAFITDFTDQDPGVIEQIRKIAEALKAEVSLVHFYTKQDRNQLAEIKRKGLELRQALKEIETKFYLIEEMDLIEGLDDFAENNRVDIFLLGSGNTHLAQHYFQPVYRKTNSCQVALPFLNLYQEKKKPCADDCLFCKEKEAEISA